MYKLYNVKRWGSMGVHLLLEELGVPYQNIWMTPEQAKAPEFKELSPLGMIPAMGLPDGRTMIESAAMVSFLVTAHPEKGMAPPAGTSDSGMFFSWLHFMSTNIYRQVDLWSEGDPNLHNLLAIAESHLKEDGPFMMGEDFSALDIYLFMLTIWGKPTEQAVLDMFPAIASVCMEMRQRPKLKAALEVHGVIKVGAYAG
jgi:glutathione S-transferase